MLRGGWGAFWALPAAAVNVLVNSSDACFRSVSCLLLGFLGLIFDLSRVLQNAGCRLFAFLLVLDQLVDLCGQIVLRLGLTALGGVVFGAAFGGVGFVVGVFTFWRFGFGFGRAFGVRAALPRELEPLPPCSILTGCRFFRDHLSRR